MPHLLVPFVLAVLLGLAGGWIGGAPLWRPTRRTLASSAGLIGLTLAKGK